MCANVYIFNLVQHITVLLVGNCWLSWMSNCNLYHQSPWYAYIANWSMVATLLPSVNTRMKMHCRTVTLYIWRLLKWMWINVSTSLSGPWDGFVSIQEGFTAHQSHTEFGEIFYKNVPTSQKSPAIWKSVKNSAHRKSNINKQFISPHFV